MSIKNRIVLLVSVLLSFALVAVLTGLNLISQTHQSVVSLYDDRIVPLQGLKNIADAYAVNVVDTNHKLRNGNISWQEAEANIRTAQAEISKLWQAYLATTLTPTEKKLADKAQALMKPADQAVDKLLKLVQQQNMSAITQFSIQELYPVIDPISEAITQLVNLQLDVAAQMNQENTQTYQNTLIWAVLASVLMLIFSLGFAWRTLKAITHPLNELVDVSHRVQSQGDFSLRIKVTHQDEIGQAAQAFNELLDNISSALRGANRVVGAIAQSDFSHRIRKDYVGDLNTLKQGINGSADSVSFMMSELAKVMDGLNKGQFDIKMAPQVPKAFSDRVEQALQSVDGVMNDINAVMEHMNRGQFDKRVTTEASGDLGRLKTNINDTLDKLETVLQEITRVVVAQSGGDLTQVIHNRCEGELQDLTEAVNATARKLVEVVSNATLAAKIVSTESQEVSRGAMSLSERVQEQAAALEQTSATMNQMNSAVENNTQHAHQASQLSIEVQNHAHEGATIMAQTIAAMTQIQDSSHKIADIVTLIDGIAFQTNLLALNAAVEAARAGEHGRGFAVVASEVRNLSQKSAEAAKDIKVLIEESVSRINHGTQLATRSGETLSVMNESVKQVSGMISQSASASEEQAEGIRQVHQAITQIDQVTQQNAALVEETSAASESMSEQAAELSRSMAFFKTAQGQGAIQPSLTSGIKKA